MRWIAEGTLASIALLAGCLKVGATFCDNGAVCPEDHTCMEDERLCEPTPNVEACAGADERETCSSSLTESGSCRDRVCTACSPDWSECRFETWTPMTSPVTDEVVGVWLDGSTAYAASSTGAMLQYDGTAWTKAFGLPVGISLVSLGAGDATSVFVGEVGGRIFPFGSSTPASPVAPQGVRRVWGAGPGDVFAVGNSGLTGHYDGSTWSWQLMTTGTFKILQDVRGEGPSSVFAVGLDGIVLRWNGSTWAVFSSPGTEGLRGVWGDPATGLFVASDTGAIYRHIEGAWSRTDVSDRGALRSIWGAAPDDVYAVGSQGAIFHFNGADWTQMVTPGINDLSYVDGNADHVFAVGVGGVIWRLSRN